MQSQLFTIILLGLGLLLFDQYLFSGFTVAFKKRGFIKGKWFKLGYTVFSIILITGTIVSIYMNIPVGVRAGFLMLFFVLMIVKVTFLPFVLADDIRRLIVRLKRKPVSTKEPAKNTIPRSEFLMKAGLITGAVPLAGIGYGIMAGA